MAITSTGVAVGLALGWGMVALFPPSYTDPGREGQYARRCSEGSNAAAGSWLDQPTTPEPEFLVLSWR